MSAFTTPTCPIGLSSDDLSAWRDHALAPEDERRIADHIGSCPACLRTVAAHEALVTALRTEQSPAPDPRNWPQLQARITSANGQRRAIRRSATRHTQRHALWGSLGAVAAVLLISALFFRLFEQRAA
ncbi:MAG TPA: zf-HC2 domain-containing protein, partial [Ktedonobacterales bacterium]|nr:zf-HC2 domain-containing protein [Ktedonobacterales bacterium]